MPVSEFHRFAPEGTTIARQHCTQSSFTGAENVCARRILALQWEGTNYIFSFAASICFAVKQGSTEYASQTTFCRIRTPLDLLLRL